MKINAIWIIIIVLLILAVVGVPTWGVWQHSYGYYPSGLLTVLVIVLIVLLLTGRL